MSCGAVRILGLDPELLWLWSRPAAVVSIRPLAWEHPYATGFGPKKEKKKKKIKLKKEKKKAKQLETKVVECTGRTEAWGSSLVV